MKTRLFIILFFVSGLLFYYSCSEKFPNPSPENISEGETNVSIQIQSLPDNAVGKNGVVVVMEDGKIYSNKLFTAEEGTQVTTYIPANKKYDIMLYILEEGEWDPKEGFHSGWYAMVYNQEVTDQKPNLNFIAKNWGTSFSSPGYLESIVYCNILEPDHGDEYEAGNIINVEVSAGDNGSGQITELELFLDGSSIATMEDAPYYHDINTKDMGEGEHILKAVATNDNDISITDEVTFSIVKDASTAPTVYFYNLDNNEEIEQGKLQDIGIYVSDDGEIKEAKLFIDGIEVNDFDEIDNYLEYSWKTENYDVGTHEIKATVTDNDNNQRSALLNVEITETDRPIIYFYQPNDGEVINQDVVYTVKLNAYDPDGISNVRLYIDNSYSSITLNQIGTNTYSYDWDTSTESTGEHELEIYARDENGYYRTRTIHVTIQ